MNRVDNVTAGMDRLSALQDVAIPSLEGRVSEEEWKLRDEEMRDLMNAGALELIIATVEAGTTPEAPILLLLDRPADVPMARRWGVQGWLVKPLDAFRLRRAARALRAGGTYEEPSGLAV